MMSSRAVTAVLLNLGLLGSPLAGLYCVGGEKEQAAACCRQGEKCNRPGITDDCCRTAPGAADGAPVATKPSPGAAAHLVSGLAAVVANGIVAIRPHEVHRLLGGSVTEPIPTATPPPPSVLRV